MFGGLFSRARSLAHPDHASPALEAEHCSAQDEHNRSNTHKCRTEDVTPTIQVKQESEAVIIPAAEHALQQRTVRSSIPDDSRHEDAHSEASQPRSARQPQLQQVQPAVQQEVGRPEQRRQSLQPALADATAYANEHEPLQQSNRPTPRQASAFLPTQQHQAMHTVEPQAQQLQQQRTGTAPDVQQLQKELMLQSKVQEELEDMLLRYERQLKAETARRMAAEASARTAAAAADEIRQQLAGSGRQAKQRTASLVADEEAVRQERATLESMRQDFEAQLHSARAEVAKAQAAMGSTKERVRAAEAAERAVIVADYEARIGSLMSELDRMRLELGQRTAAMAAEMDRWKRQAALTAAAVVEAKNEVLERKKELDSTKDKMDHLIDKLYGHKEASMSLSGAIAAAAQHQQAATNSFLQQQAAISTYGSLAGASIPGAASMHMHPSMVFSQAGMRPAVLSSLAHSGYEGARIAGGLHHSNVKAASTGAKTSRASEALVPTSQQQKAKSAGSLSQRLSKMAAAGFVGEYGNLAQPFLLTGMSTAGELAEPGWLPQVQSSRKSRVSCASSSKSVAGQGAKGGAISSKLLRAAGGSYAALHQQQQGSISATSAHAGGNPMPVQTYSKYAESAAKYVQVHKPQAKHKQQSQQHKRPDRFEESAKSAAMIAAMANKW